MGEETKVACLASVQLHGQVGGFTGKHAGKLSETDTFDVRIRRDLQMHNGIVTSDEHDTFQYGMCYAAAVNASDLMCAAACTQAEPAEDARCPGRAALGKCCPQ